VLERHGSQRGRTPAELIEAFRVNRATVRRDLELHGAPGVALEWTAVNGEVHHRLLGLAEYHRVPDRRAGAAPNRSAPVGARVSGMAEALPWVPGWGATATIVAPQELRAYNREEAAAIRLCTDGPTRGVAGQVASLRWDGMGRIGEMSRGPSREGGRLKRAPASPPTQPERRSHT